MAPVYEFDSPSLVLLHGVEARRPCPLASRPTMRSLMTSVELLHDRYLLMLRAVKRMNHFARPPTTL